MLITHQFFINIIYKYNLKEDYVYGNYFWKVILVTAPFKFHSKSNSFINKKLVQMVFGCDIILTIDHTDIWE